MEIAHSLARQRVIHNARHSGMPQQGLLNVIAMVNYGANIGLASGLRGEYLFEQGVC